MATALSWFEIPTTDLDRAIRFYETVLAVSLRREVFEGVAMAVFPHGDKAPGGALIQDAQRKPASDGVLIFLNTAGQLDACLERIAKAGGKVLTPKLDIGAPGFIATLRDTEGNVVALHQER
jgi:predicted enzyme related to lactoylglutathione lyase